MTPNTELSDVIPSLWPAIFWLEGGCNPREVAKELRIYAERIDAARKRAASPAPLREADTSTAQKINAPDAGPMPEICDGMSKSDVWAYAHLCGFRSAGIEADGDGGKGPSTHELLELAAWHRDMEAWKQRDMEKRWERIEARIAELTALNATEAPDA
jgi:hypothetical protein